MPGLTAFLDRLPPAQRQLVLLGVPVVAAVVIARAVKKPSADQRDVPSTSGVVPAANPDALSVGQLAAWESDWTNALYDLQRSIDDLEKGGVSAPSPGPAAPVNPAPGGPAPAPPPPATPDPEAAVAAQIKAIAEAPTPWRPPPGPETEQQNTARAAHAWADLRNRFGV